MSTSFRHKKSAASLVAALRSDEHTPFSAMIEIADRCNEVCVHCYQIQGQKGEMTTAQIMTVIDELADMGVLFLTISGGEPTLRPDFLDIVAHARKRKFAVKIFTNGLTMTRDLARRLGELAVREVQMSLYSHRADVHDWVTRVPGSWQKTVDGARNLRAERVPVVLKSPLMAFNAPEYREYVEFVQQLDADYMMDPHIDPREDADRETEVLRIDDDTYVRARRDKFFAREQPDEPPAKVLDRSVCGACSGNVHVEPNGELRPCTQLDVAVGHAVTDGVRRAWEQNESGQRIRRLTWNELHGCRDCDLQPYCGRCFANARVEVGDALGPYETACNRARLNFEVKHGTRPQVLPSEDGARDGRLGPYERAGEAAFRAIPDDISAEDERLAETLGWTRSGASPGPEGSAEPGQLVQIRRPGRKTKSEERVPSRPGSGSRPDSSAKVEA